ncbi:MAG: bifunctional phosphopantothenoylcysteine decarboxylase/phosphopantothenate synthase [Austwickia sp.]|nr:bifunctional phosphopantothenoylcysteine decarboxylase/phosphopantothenate synthase [Austwickia sp.]MCO5309353.1 bifunctional phosphopantothenoylcysteine decarboxylase/phosphopantothenate synthase [Austwickia sp.]
MVADTVPVQPLRVVLGVGGGIAAYKACLLSRLFSESGADVTVVPTEAALHFVGAATWEALSGHPVSTSVWDGVDEVRHVRIGQHADLVVVAPATADLLARAAHGLANDLLTNVLLTARCPVVMAPAMHTEMWLHPATQANVATLRARGVHVIDPAVGRLTGVDTGPGRLPEPADIHAAAMAVLPSRRDDAPAGDEHVPAPDAQREPGAAHAAHAGLPLACRRVVITAGGTREALDPVRYLGNRSSGKQGYALAAAAAERGANVTLISANVGLPDPVSRPDRYGHGTVSVHRVESALELAEAVAAEYPQADAIVMAAAVADFRPKTYAAAKIKKSHEAGREDDAPVIELVRNPDILAGLVRRRAEAGAQFPVIVGFAAETGDDSGSVLDLARAKLARKGCDLLVANEVGRDAVFGKDVTTVTILAAGQDAPLAEVAGSKAQAAAAILDALAALL